MRRVTGSVMVLALIGSAVAVAPDEADALTAVTAASSSTMVVAGSVTPDASGRATLAGSSYMQFPAVLALPSADGGRSPRTLLVSYNQDIDSGAVDTPPRTLRSTDGGRSWSPVGNVPLLSATRLDDGSILAVDFRTKPKAVPVPTDTPTVPPTSADTPTTPATSTETPTSTDPPTSTETPTSTDTPTSTETPTSTDTPTSTPSAGAGVTGTPQPATAAQETSTPAPAPPVPPRALTAPHVQVLTSTGSSEFDTPSWTSRDNGATWSTFTGTARLPFAADLFLFHRGIVQARDGALLATTYVVRSGRKTYDVELMRSADGGMTWTWVSTMAEGNDSVANEGRDEATMIRVPNGDLVAVLRQDAPIFPAVCTGAVVGDPLLITRSSDDGLTWSPPAPLNVPGVAPSLISSADPHLLVTPRGQLALSFGRPGTQVLFSQDGTGRTWTPPTTTYADRTSGYTSLVSVGDNRLLQFGDMGSNWCFTGTAPRPVGIWSREIDVAPPDGRRIDVRRLVASGQARISTDMVDRLTSASGPAAVVDGSIEPDAGAVRRARSGTLTLDLGGLSTLTGASLVLPVPGSSANAAVSSDGRTWRTVASWYSSGRYSLLTDRGFPAGVVARYVRFNVGSPQDLVELSEIQLRTLPSTFEDDAVGSVPAGYVAVSAGAPSVTVQGNAAGRSSDRAVRLTDRSSSATAIFAKSLPLTSTRTFSMMLNPVAIRCALVLTLNAYRGPVSQKGLMVSVWPDGSVKRWDGAAWKLLSGQGRVRAGTWSAVRIQASASGASVYVNGVLLGRVPVAAGTTGFTGVEVSSGGTAPVGDDVLLDEVYAAS
ncbi:exo-alpha-sialidase [Terrabacter sp. 2YAF2]|uniref:exo-alpha-sialidase n=1 Tax=Terrabacter sp. 2YAF2 TaxID=3233026 RepID=UPI003F9D4F2B